MKSYVVYALAFSFILGCCALESTIHSNKTQDTEDEFSPSKTAAQFAITFLKIFAGVCAIYYWGCNRKTKSFKDMTAEAPKSFVRNAQGKIDTNMSLEELDPNYWYIHGKAYDLAGFMSRHPGGYRPLMMARGRDCTELFESYHSLVDTPREMLKKFHYPAKDLKNYVSMFNWDMSHPANAFTVELRAEVREYIKKQDGLTTCPKINLAGSFIWTFFTMWVTYEYYWSGALWSSIVVPAMWWGSFIQTFHDATHFALSRNELINSFFVYLYPYFSSPTTWDHQHVIGHHVFTNIFKKDPDLNHGIPIFRIHPRFRYRPWMKFQFAWIWLIWFISTLHLSTTYDWTGISTGVYHGILAYTKLSKTRMFFHLFGRALSVFLTIGIPFSLFPFYKALWWSVSFYSVWGFFFMLITQVNHITEECLEGAGEKNECWAIHQVKTSHDYSHPSFFWWLISGGLNLQIEHHLFPGLYSYHLYGVIPIVQKLCKKYDIPYNYSPTYYSAICKYLKVVSNGSKKETVFKEKGE